MNIKYPFLSILLILMTISISGQETDYYMKYFSTENGLPSNTIKDIIQDKNGFIWIATDAGVAKYDGLDFKIFNEELQSSYVKDLYDFDDNGVIVTTDLGLGFFHLGQQKNHYKTLINGSTDETDSLVFYPKLVFVDSKERIWISETNDISKFENEKFEKYKFDFTYYTNDYKRSYIFLEDKDNKIIATSWKGYCFYFDESRNQFLKIPFDEEGEFFINSIQMINGEIYFGTSLGIYQATISKNYKNLKLKRIGDLNNISCLYQVDESNILVGTWAEGLHKYNFIKNELERVPEVTNDYINSILVDKNGGIWISSDDGVFLLKSKLFKTVDLSEIYSIGIPKYISSIKSINKQLYFSSGYRLFKILQDAKGKLSFLELPNSEHSGVQDFIITDNGYWISYQDGTLHFFDSNGNVRFNRKLDNGILGRLFLDKNKNLWAFGVVSKSVFKIDEHFNLEIFSKEKTKSQYIEVIKQLDDGKIYIAGVNDNYNFILYFDGKLNEFLPLKTDTQNNELNYAHVFDIDYNKEKGSILIATSNGFIEYYNSKFSKLFIGTELENISTRAVMWEDKDVLWLGTDKGLFITNSKDFAQYNRFDGLPSATISGRCIIKDYQNKIWIGTVSGLTYLKSESMSVNKSPTPKIVNKEFDNNLQLGESEYLEGISIRFNYSNLDYPNDRTLYKTRVIGIDTNWTIPSKTKSIVYSNFDEGDYSFQVKAKTPGLIWSETLNFNFKIKPHWYLTIYMKVFYILSIAALITGIIFLMQSIKFKNMQKRRKVLSELVHLKTKELQKEKAKTDTLLSQISFDRAQLYSIMNSSPDLIAFKSNQGIYLACNDTFCEFFNKERINIIGISDYEIFSKEIADEIVAKDKKLSDRGYFEKYESTCLDKNNNEIPFEIYRTVVYDEDENPLGILTMYHDITENKITEKKLKEYADTQKELLREVNHRIKNNLSSLISILHIEEDKIKVTGNYNNIIPDIISRIRSISNIHELLSLNQWKPMKLDKLCLSIIKGAINGIGASEIINFDVKGTSKIVSNDQAHKLGLVINELVTNSIKHFTYPYSEINIFVELREIDDKISICYGDNGPGYPSEIINGDFSKCNIGIELVNGIIEHSLQGEVKYSNDNGARTELIFNNEHNSNM